MFKIRKKKSLTIPNNVIKITPFILINKQHCIFVSFLYLPDFTGTHPQQYFPLVNGMFFNQKKKGISCSFLSLKNSLHLTIGITIIPKANFSFLFRDMDQYYWIIFKHTRACLEFERACH